MSLKTINSLLAFFFFTSAERTDILLLLHRWSPAGAKKFSWRFMETWPPTGGEGESTYLRLFGVSRFPGILGAFWVKMSELEEKVYNVWLDFELSLCEHVCGWMDPNHYLWFLHFVTVYFWLFHALGSSGCLKVTTQAGFFHSSHWIFFMLCTLWHSFAATMAFSSNLVRDPSCLYLQGQRDPLQLDGLLHKDISRDSVQSRFGKTKMDHSTGRTL